MPLVSQVADEKELTKYYIGFPKGLNTLQDRSLVGDKNLIEATNVELVVDGVQRRKGTLKVFDDGGGSYVYGAIGYYKKSTSERKFLRVANGKLQYLNGAVWSNIGSTSFANTETNFIQARDLIFIYNGGEALRKYDNSTVSTYATITTPVNLTVTATGGTASTAYSYRVSAFNTSGESLACVSVAISNGVLPTDLSTTKYNALAWTATAGASGYNIYGRYATGYEEVYMTTVYTNSYNDVGTDTPLYTKPVPTANTSGGIIAKGGCYTLSRQWVFGITEGSTYYPCRLAISGNLDYIDSFAANDYGGGSIDIGTNDGGEIVSVIPYQNGVLVFKTNGIYHVYFDQNGVPALTEITKSHGGVSFRSAQAIDNDILYVGQKENRIAVWILGQQANITTNTLRTNEISVFIKTDLEDINRTYLNKIATFYYDDKFGLTYTKTGYSENMQGFVFDTKFGGWVKWDGAPMKQGQYVPYDDGTTVHLYGCANDSGYMWELFYSAISDNGVAFKSLIGTKNFNAEMFNVEKIWRNPVHWFKYIEGGQLTCEVWVDSSQFQGTAIFGVTSGGGIGSDLAGESLAGDFYSLIPTVTEGADIPMEISTLKISRSIRFYLRDNGKNTNWLYMGLALNYSPLIGKPLPESNRVEIS